MPNKKAAASAPLPPVTPPDCLYVWQAGRLMGELRRVGDQVAFCYTSQATQPLSRSLPLQPRLNVGEPVSRFFSSLLPPGQSRALCAKALGCLPDDVITLLAHMGADAAGGIALLPTDTPPKIGTQAAIDQHELHELLLQLTDLPMLAGVPRISQTLCGARPKLGLIRQPDGRFALPLDGAHSTHVIKPDLAPWQGAALTEVFCQQLASRVGVPASQAELVMLGDLPCSVIARYDIENGTSIAAETFAQALGCGDRPRESMGGPSLAACFGLIETFADDVRAEQQVLMDYVLFNALIGNANADSSLFVIIHADNGTRLAPLHGALCAAAFPHLQQRLALRIGKAAELGALRSQDLRQLVAATQLDMQDVAGRAQEMAQQLRQHSRTLADDFSHYPAGPTLTRTIIATIEQNSTLLMQTLRNMRQTAA